MITNKLQKQITLYRTQFERFTTEIDLNNIDRLSIELDGLLFRLKYMNKNNLDLDKIPMIRDEFAKKAVEMRKAFSTFLFQFICKIITVKDPFKLDDLIDVFAEDVNIDQNYVKFNMIVLSDNEEFLKYIEETIGDDIFNMYQDEHFRFYTDSYNDGIAKAYPELFENKHQDVIGTGDDSDVFVHSVTLQSSEACNLQCTYCVGPDTLIHTAEGYPKKIKDIKVGDVVKVFEEFPPLNQIHPTKFKLEDQLFDAKVKQVFKRRAEVVEIQSPYIKRHMYITKDHKVLTNNGWRPVSLLDPGTHKVAVRDGNLIRFTSNFRIYNEPMEMDVYNIETESGTYIANGLCIHNCYQFNKTPMRMDLSTAIEFIENLVTDKYGFVNRYNSPALILEFIGGEPFLEIDMTRKAYEYFLKRCYELNHPWFTLHRLSICSNGLLYFDKKVQDFFKDYHTQISFNISIDGNKELHDSCRIQPNGEGSYDVAMAALNHFNKHYNRERNSKMTLAPANIKHLSESVIDFIDNGMTVINLNCVFEEGWKPEHARIEYEELKKVTNYLLDNDLEHIFLSIFRDKQEGPLERSNDGNYCFKAGTAVLTPRGNENIENIREGDLMYSGSCTLQKVVKMNSYNSNDNRILTFVGGFPIHCTSDHQILAYKVNGFGQGNPKFYPVSELDKGDRIAIPLLDFSKNKETWVDESTAFALGIYISYGCIFASELFISPGADSDGFYERKLYEAGLRFRIRKMGSTKRYEIGREAGPINERFFKLCQDCGGASFNKRIPPIIFQSPITIVEAMMKGTINPQNYNRSELRFNTTSNRLANDVLMILRALKYYPSASEGHPTNGTKLNGHHEKKKTRYVITYNQPKVKSNNMFKYDAALNVYWVQIKDIIKDDSYDVYCPTLMPVEGNVEEHTFIANGIVVKNCGGSGSMLAVRPNGQFYPCIRFMPTALKDGTKDFCMGCVKDGLIERSDNSSVLYILDNITRRSQSNDICYECPIANACASCLAMGLVAHDNVNKKATFICIMVIAETLANLYYWNALSIKHPEWKMKARRNVLPDEWALAVIDEDELDLLKKMEVLALMNELE